MLAIHSSVILLRFPATQLYVPYTLPHSSPSPRTTTTTEAKKKIRQVNEEVRERERDLERENNSCCGLWACGCQSNLLCCTRSYLFLSLSLCSLCFSHDFSGPCRHSTTTNLVNKTSIGFGLSQIRWKVVYILA